MHILVNKMRIDYIWAQILVGMILAVESFIVYRFVVFRHRKKIKSASLTPSAADQVPPPFVGQPQ